MQLQLTRRGDYALRAMLGLASRGAGATVSSRTIAQEWGIPAGFLVQVLGILAREGLVMPVLGRRGGYRLTRPPAEISVLDVVRAAEGKGEEARCVLRGGPCRPDGRCLVHDLFTDARARYLDELASTSLAAVLDEAGWRPASLRGGRPPALRPSAGGRPSTGDRPPLRVLPDEGERPPPGV